MSSIQPLQTRRHQEGCRLPLPFSLLHISSLLLFLFQGDLSQWSPIDLSCKCLHFCPPKIGSVLQCLQTVCWRLAFTVPWASVDCDISEPLCCHCAARVSGLCRSSTRLCFARSSIAYTLCCLCLCDHCLLPCSLCGQVMCRVGLAQWFSADLHEL
jgi:hypothetical protein